MAKHILTDAILRNAKPAAKYRRLNDGSGFYLLIKPNGAMWWRFDYIIDGKRKTLSLGVYPTTGLADARRKAEDARGSVANGLDPSDKRKEVNEKRLESGLPIIDSFEYVVREWHEMFKAKWTEDHARSLLTRLEHDVFPFLGKRPIVQIDALELLEVMQRMEARGVIYTTHRALQNCGQIFRYGVLTRRCARDPSSDLRGALSPIRKRHHASIDPHRE